MFSSYRRTKKGSIVKVVRECYLRDDIHCGRESCGACKRFKLDVNEPFAPISGYLMDEARVSLNKLHPRAHYVVPDFDTVNNQIDVIADPAFGNDSYSPLGVSTYLIMNFFVKHSDKNELNRCRNPDESIGEYRENLCREACEWLQNHFKTT
ncbi:hypothetical protein BLA29_001872, partial [Euroglyphus maynei]